MQVITHNVEKLLGYQPPCMHGFHSLALAGNGRSDSSNDAAMHKVHTVTSHYISWYFLFGFEMESHATSVCLESSTWLRMTLNFLLLL